VVWQLLATFKAEARALNPAPLVGKGGIGKAPVFPTLAGKAGGQQKRIVDGISAHHGARED
jgi:hypothetical protein